MSNREEHPIRITIHLEGNDTPVWSVEMESNISSHSQFWANFWLALRYCCINRLDSYIQTARATNAYPQYNDVYDNMLSEDVYHNPNAVEGRGNDYLYYRIGPFEARLHDEVHVSLWDKANFYPSVRDMGLEYQRLYREYRNAQV